MTLRRDDLGPRDTVERHGFAVTSALRTVIDVSRRLPMVEAVVVADMALHKGLFERAALESFVVTHAGWWGAARLRAAVELVEPKSESAMETRLRLLLIGRGLPAARGAGPGQGQAGADNRPS